MTEKELSQLSDEALLAQAKKAKSASIINAVLIGFAVGIIIYSAVKNTLGFFTLIPIFIIYKMVNNSTNDKALQRILKERNLK